MIKSWINKIKKGVRAGLVAIKGSNEITDGRIVRMIREFENSDVCKCMKVGERYYKVQNDVLTRKENSEFKANNRIAHGKYKTMVDEKISYLLCKNITLKCDDEEYVKKIRELLSKRFQYQLKQLGYESSNKGIGWLHCYINELGEFKTILIPAEQCIPIWKDATRTELEGMIRVYDSFYWILNEKKSVRHVEIWTSDTVKYYKLENELLISTELEDGHYVSDGNMTGWGKVPFVGFKNNHLEMPDISFIKSLLDSYDTSRSEVSNYIEEVKNLIFVLKGYGGANLDEFMRDLNQYRAIKIDDPEEGGVDALTPTMDITAVREHYEQLKRDIADDGQSINKDLDKFGASPSGVALKFMYAGLDLKCNLMESEYQISFEQLLYFVNQYLGINGNTYSEEVELIFNRDMEINETEVIENCGKSRGIISNESVVANHPWVGDLEKELEELEKQESLDNQWGTVPVGDGGGSDEE